MTARLLLIMSAVLCASALSLATKSSCVDELERLRTDLRLRKAELLVTRGMLDAAEKRLEKCKNE